MTKALVFDFDGVVVPESEFFKRDAWPRVFASYGDRYLPFFVDAEQRFGAGRGGDRFDMLRAVYEGLGESSEKIPALIRSGAEVFDTYVQKKIAETGISEDAQKALTRLSDIFPLYLNSATPVDALERSIAALGINTYFKGVLGRPKSKVENFREVMSRESIAPEEILFVGDSESDCAAAQEFGCQFIGFANSWNSWSNEKPFRIVRALSEIEIST